MSAYNAPDADLEVFNPVDYYQNLNLFGGNIIGGGTAGSVDLAYIEANFLQFPTSQGGENIVGSLNATSGISSDTSISATTTVFTPSVTTGRINPSLDPIIGTGILLIGDDESIYTGVTSIQVGGVTTSAISELFCAGLHLKTTGIRAMTNANTLYVGADSTGEKGPVQVCKLSHLTNGTIQNYDGTAVNVGNSLTTPTLSAPTVNATTALNAGLVKTDYLNTTTITAGEGILNICNNDTLYPQGVDVQVGGVTGTLNSRLLCGGVKLSLNGITANNGTGIVYVGANSTGAVDVAQVGKLSHLTDGTIQNYDSSPIKVGASGFQLSGQCNTPTLNTALYQAEFFALGDTQNYPSMVFSQNKAITDNTVGLQTIYCDTTDVFTQLPINTILTENTYVAGFRMDCGYSYGNGALAATGAYIDDYGVYNSVETVNFGGAVIFVTITFNVPFISVPNIHITGRIAQATNPLCIGLQYAVDSYTTASVGGIVYYTGFVFNVCNIRSGTGNTAGQAWGVNWSATGRLR